MVDKIPGSVNVTGAYCIERPKEWLNQMASRKNDDDTGSVDITGTYCIVRLKERLNQMASRKKDYTGSVAVTGWVS